MTAQTQSPPATLEYSAEMTEAELLHEYLGKRLRKGNRKEPLDHILAEFAEYRRELEQLRASIREAIASSERGESGPLDLEDVKRRGRERMAKEGIVD